MTFKKPNPYHDKRNEKTVINNKSKVLHHLLEKKIIFNIKKVAEELGMNRNTVRKYLEELQREKIVDKTIDGVRAFWQLKTLGFTNGGKSANRFEFVKVNMVHIDQRAMSGSEGLIYLDITQNENLDYIKLEYDDQKETLAISGKKSIIHTIETNLGSDELIVYAHPINESGGYWKGNCFVVRRPKYVAIAKPIKPREVVSVPLTLLEIKQTPNYPEKTEGKEVSRDGDDSLNEHSEIINSHPPKSSGWVSRSSKLDIWADD